MSDTGTVLKEYDNAEDKLKRFEKKTRILLIETLGECALSFHSVQSRTKSRESLRNKCERPDKKYQCLSDVTDVVAFRIITYFEDDVDKVATLLDANFSVDKTRSIDKRQRAATVFGYSALHYVCQYTPQREQLLDNRPYIGLCWEVQICSILQHAWNEIEHDIGYKSEQEIPTDITRRLHRISGALEIIDSEFKEIRNRTENYKKAIELRLETQDEDVSDVQLDTISLRTFIEQDGIVQEADALFVTRFDAKKGGTLGNKTLDATLRGLHHVGIHTLQSVREKLKTYMNELPKLLWDTIDILSRENPTSRIEVVLSGLSVNILMTFISALDGEETLNKLYQQTGMYGELAPLFARAYAESAAKIRETR